MNCLQCGHATTGPKHCTHCGANLPNSCPSCGWILRDGHRHCGNCGRGSSIAAIVASRPEAAGLTQLLEAFHSSVHSAEWIRNRASGCVRATRANFPEPVWNLISHFGSVDVTLWIRESHFLDFEAFWVGSEARVVVNSICLDRLAPEELAFAVASQAALLESGMARYLSARKFFNENAQARKDAGEPLNKILGEVRDLMLEGVMEADRRALQASGSVKPAVFTLVKHSKGSRHFDLKYDIYAEIDSRKDISRVEILAGKNLGKLALLVEGDFETFSRIKRLDAFARSAAFYLSMKSTRVHRHLGLSASAVEGCRNMSLETDGSLRIRATGGITVVIQPDGTFTLLAPSTLTAARYQHRDEDIRESHAAGLSDDAIIPHPETSNLTAEALERPAQSIVGHGHGTHPATHMDDDQRLFGESIDQDDQDPDMIRDEDGIQYPVEFLETHRVEAPEVELISDEIAEYEDDFEIDDILTEDAPTYENVATYEDIPTYEDAVDFVVTHSDEDILQDVDIENVDEDISEDQGWSETQPLEGRGGFQGDDYAEEDEDLEAGAVTTFVDYDVNAILEESETDNPQEIEVIPEFEPAGQFEEDLFEDSDFQSRDFAQAASLEQEPEATLNEAPADDLYNIDGFLDDLDLDMDDQPIRKADISNDQSMIESLETPDDSNSSLLQDPFDDSEYPDLGSLGIEGEELIDHVTEPGTLPMQDEILAEEELIEEDLEEDLDWDQDITVEIWEESPAPLEMETPVETVEDFDLDQVLLMEEADDQLITISTPEPMEESGQEIPGKPADALSENQDRIYVVDTGNNRIQIFDMQGKFLHSFGQKGAATGQFDTPKKIFADPSGFLLVADFVNCRIQKFDLMGNHLLSFGNPGTNHGEFNYPMGLTTDPDGRVFVVDAWNNRIQVFDPDGKFMSRFGEYGEKPGQFNSPNGIRIGRDGNLVITDSGNSRVQIFSPDGEFITTFGRFGSSDEPGEFDTPSGLAIDGQGNIHIADTGNNRVQIFDGQGEFISSFGSWGDENGSMDTPNGIHVSSDGRIFVADTWNHRIQTFDASGKYLSSFGGHGSGEGYFIYASDIYIHQVS